MKTTDTTSISLNPNQPEKESKNNENQTYHQIIPSCGNVFEDLQLPNSEEEMFKSDLAIEIGRLIKGKGLTQRKAAEVTGISQPRISMMMRDQLDEISVDALLRAVRRLGHNIEVRISKEELPAAETSARVLVT